MYREDECTYCEICVLLQTTIDTVRSLSSNFQRSEMTMDLMILKNQETSNFVEKIDYVDQILTLYPPHCMGGVFAKDSVQAVAWLFSKKSGLFFE